MGRLIREKPVVFGFTLFSLILAGFFIFVSVHSYDSSIAAPPAINYAPNLWFDSQEKYYPTNILDFYFENGIEIEGEVAVEKYSKLSLKEKLNNLTVFYHIEDEGNQWVYQYWFFYVFNDYPTLTQNKHYGDWESVFVFVDKDSREVVKVIGTAHQRKLFDTEIYEPENNHIWSYVGNGSHAVCVDKESDGKCNKKRWRFFEKWDKKGPKVGFREYTLVEFTPKFIHKFKGALTLEKSSELGIELPNILKKITKKDHIPLGNKPPTFAWEQSNYYSPEEIRPIGWRYISDKIGKVKNKTFAFIGGLVIEVSAFFKKEQPEQGASISSIISEDPGLLNPPIQILPANLPLSNPVEENVIVEQFIAREVEETEIVINTSPAVIELVEELQPEPEVIEIVEIIEEVIVEDEPVIIPLPIKPPTFISGGGPPPVSAPAADPGDTTAPDAPMVTSHNSGDALATTTINLVGTAEAESIILITSPSSYSTTTDQNGDWQQTIELSEGENTVTLKAEDGSGNQGNETSLTLNVDTTAPSDILDLSANQGNNRGEISLTWTAPGDDGNNGTASEYILRYSTSSEITSLNWASSTDIISEPAPSVSGSTESLTVSNLDTSQTYYWSIKSEDEMDNSSDISNSASSSPSGLANNLVISELQVRGGSSEDDEFIEIYNSTGSAVDLSSYSIQYRGSESGSFDKENLTGSIPVNGFFLITNDSYNGHMQADLSHNSFQMSATGGNVFLVNNQTILTDPEDNSIIDKVSYGTGAYLFPESSEYSTAPGQEQSLERKNRSTSTAELLAVNGDNHWQGNNWDGDNNSGDFVLQTDPNPQSSLSLTEPRGSFASLADTVCPMIQYDIGHSGLSSEANNATGSPTSTPKWTVSLGSSNPTSPIISSDGSIYVGAANGDLYKLTTNGVKSKFYDTGTAGTVKTPVLDSDGNIYLTDNAYLYAVNSSGQLIWKYIVANTSEPVIDSSGNIYIADDTNLFAFTPNGEKIWQSEQLSNTRWIRTPVIDSSGVLYTVGRIGNSEYVYAVNQSDGTIKWQTSAGGYSTAPSLDNQGTLYIGTESDGLYALNSSDGSQKWANSLGNISSPIPAINGDNIYVGTDNYAFYDIDRTNGSTNWTFASFDDKVYASATIDSNGIIYIGGQDKMFYALNTDKSIKWQAELNDRISYGAVIGSDGTIYAVSIDGTVYAFGQ